ncbi:putative pentatricopeptide repeat-containing protein [Camellia lanceoleosa]|uniref:Pentatricopeptide repeat-containing protein n=1 Tax=Camellia lanceoleosa TaxID=1840588 RepID=A0ACC0I7A8_9ERIC|nr:putative pentatricopeptide repeat-containing protein [Camellia lanceoleosa]
MIEEAEKAFRLIEEKDVISWNTLIAACSHCDDHGKGLSIFKEMTNVFSLWLDDFTYASALAVCAGITFVRHGKQIHAHLIRMKPDGDPEHLARTLLKHDPVTTSPYVLLSNLYASDGMSNCAVEARKMLKGSGLRKKPRHSLIEVKGVVKKFTIGDFSHARIEHIVHILKTLSWEGDEIFSYYWSSHLRERAFLGTMLKALVCKSMNATSMAFY